MKKQKTLQFLALAASIALLYIGCNFNTAAPSALALLTNIQKILPRGATFSCGVADATTTAVSISGNVRNFDSALPITGARVTTVKSLGVELTSATGEYKISGIDPAITTETINVTVAGYDSFTVDRNLAGCQNLKANITLDPVNIVALGVDAFVLDSSILDKGRIQSPNFLLERN